MNMVFGPFAPTFVCMLMHPYAVTQIQVRYHMFLSARPGMASLTHNTDVNWRACSSMPLRCASIPVSHTPIHFTDRTKRTIHGNRFHAADLTSMIRHTSWLRRRTRSMKWYLGLSARPSFLLSSLCLHQRSQTPPWENNHEAVYRKIMLYSSTVPTSPTSQTSPQCAPLTLPFHSHAASNRICT